MSKLLFLTVVTTMIVGAFTRSAIASETIQQQVAFGKARGGFEIGLNLETRNAEDGPILVTVLKNASDTPLTVWKIQDLNNDLQISLSKFGQIVPQMTHDSSYGGLGKPRRILGPNQTLNFSTQLNTLYKLTPGVYELRVNLHLRDHQRREIAVPTSNILRFIV